MSDYPLPTALRNRHHYCGSFETNGSSAVANVLGDGGTPAHASTGVWTITFEKHLGVMERGFAWLSANTGDQIASDLTYSNSTGVTVLTLTVLDISGGAAADVDGPRLNWDVIFHQRAS